MPGIARRRLLSPLASRPRLLGVPVRRIKYSTPCTREPLPSKWSGHSTVRATAGLLTLDFCTTFSPAGQVELAYTVHVDQTLHSCPEPPPSFPPPAPSPSSIIAHCLPASSHPAASPQPGRAESIGTRSALRTVRVTVCCRPDMSTSHLASSTRPLCLRANHTLPAQTAWPQTTDPDCCPEPLRVSCALACR